MVGPVPPLKLAVSVVLLAPMTMLCCGAPPSDHDVKTLLPCGDGAEIVCVEPTMLVTVNGVVRLVLPYTTWSPDGEELNVTCDVCGSTRLVTVPVAPPLSVAHSAISK